MIKKQDPVKRDFVGVQSVPVGNDWTESGPFTIPAGGAGTFNVTTTPANNLLSLWNYLFSIRIDVNDNDHRFSNGSALTSEQRSMELTNWMDFIDSFDPENVRVVKIRIHNYGASSHDYYLLYKAYSFVSIGQFSTG